jgi:hypothetical protein
MLRSQHRLRYGLARTFECKPIEIDLFQTMRYSAAERNGKTQETGQDHPLSDLLTST